MNPTVARPWTRATGCPLRDIHERLGRGVGGCELDQFTLGELVWGRQGLGLVRKKCTAQGGHKESHVTSCHESTHNQSR